MRLDELRYIKDIQQTNWEEIRDIVAINQPVMAKIIDEISPGQDLPLYIANYPFGKCIGDTNVFYYPAIEEKSNVFLSRLKDRNFKYAGSSSPLSLILNNSAELFIKHNNDSIPCHLYGPGSIISLPRELNITGKSYHPSNLMCMTAGTHSIFSLQSLGQEKKHQVLKTRFGIQYRAAKNIHEHWNLFVDLFNQQNKEPWFCSLLFFTDPWIELIRKDPAWEKLRSFFYQYAWSKTEFIRNKEYYNYLISMSQIKVNVKHSVPLL